MRLGEKVRVLREARGLGQAELAERVGIHQVTLSQWERGTRPFDGDYLEAVAEALEVEPGLFHSVSPWSKLEEAKRHYDAVIAEVQAILKETADNTSAATADNTGSGASERGLNRPAARNTNMLSELFPAPRIRSPRVPVKL